MMPDLGDVTVGPGDVTALGRQSTITIGAQQVTAQPRIPAEARTLLNDLGWSGH